MSGGAVAIAFGAALAGAAFGILTGIVLSRIVGSYIDGGLGAYGCILAGGLFLVIAGSVVVFHSIWLFVLLIALVALSPVFSRKLERAEDRRYYSEQIQQFVEAVRADPRNLAARTSLAETLYTEGRIDEAIDQYTEIVRLSPRALQEAHRLQQFIREREERRDPPVRCPSCGQMNPRSRIHCSHCESMLKPANEIKQWLASTGLKQIVWSSAIAVGIITAVLFLGSLLPPTGQLVAILSILLILGIALLVRMHMN